MIYSSVLITDKLHLWRERKLMGNKIDLCHSYHLYVCFFLFFFLGGGGYFLKPYNWVPEL